MDALMLINPDLPAASATPLAQIVGRARIAQGVIAYVAAPADEDMAGEAAATSAVPTPAAAPASGDSSVNWAAELVADLYGDAGEDPAPDSAAVEVDPALLPTDDDLVLESVVPDAFDGVDDLAAGLHEMNIDRVLLGGVDVQGALYETAMAALACNFDVVVLDDAAVTADGGTVDWLDEAARAGANPRPTADAWLRM